MEYESPVNFIISLLEDEDQKVIIRQISKGKEPEEILEYFVKNLEGE